MVDSIYYYCADRGLLPDAVTVVGAHSPRGALPHQIFDAMAQADLVVQPSRAEGYGMIALAAIVAGVPLASTASTGECDFLYASRAWCKIDTSESGPLEGEEGLAPTVTPVEIERAVTSALARLGALRASAASSETQTCVRCYTWRRCMHSWVDYAREMLAHTARGLRLPPL
jgi:glycosyltransferase involved in cell wall biosynthesis